MLDKSAKTAGRVLLPDYVTPTKYDLKLTPDLQKFTFAGVVAIDLTTSESASDHSKITLHAKELLFKSAKLQFDSKALDAEEVSRTPSVQSSPQNCQESLSRDWHDKVYSSCLLWIY